MYIYRCATVHGNVTCLFFLVLISSFWWEILLICNECLWLFVYFTFFHLVFLARGDVNAMKLQLPFAPKLVSPFQEQQFLVPINGHDWAVWNKIEINTQLECLESNIIQRKL